MRTFLLATLLLIAFFSTPVSSFAEAKVTPAEIRTAIEAAIPLLEKGSAGSAEKRSCFTCHSQAMPILALTEAKRRGFKLDGQNLQRQLQHTKKHLDRGKTNYEKGKGQGGGVITAGYALWALQSGGQDLDETTTAVVHYLLESQQSQGFYRKPSKRPPSSGSDFTVTYLAMYGLDFFGMRDQQERIVARKKRIKEWAEKTPAKDNEDRVFRALLLRDLGSERPIREAAVLELLDTQHPDGGWAQTAEMKSDAYATGSALTALLIVGKATLNCNHPAIQKGLQYLLKHQGKDGSWHVATRAKGFQTYFESGFPHKKDQFISIAASSWATLALTLALPGETLE